MNIVFISNFINHHQLPISLEFLKIADNYTFIATTPIDQERLRLGYIDENKQHDFVLTTYDYNENLDKAKELLSSCDIAIIGATKDKFMLPRIKKGLLTFHYSERYYKRGLNSKTFIRYFISSLFHITRFQNKIYYLCASAYTAGDVNTFANFKNRTFKWGYFTKTLKYSLSEIKSLKSSTKPIILWAGRLISWKHPELAIEVAKKLKNDGFAYQMQIIGTGEMQKSLIEKIHENELENNVNFLGAMSPDNVRTYMEKANIFLFTSDFNEGWGAVLNEAMNSACAVVASHAIGSVPFLLKHNNNGLIYENGDLNGLYNSIVRLIRNPTLALELGINAYKTILDEWNAEVAAKRLIDLSVHLSKGKTSPYSSGPCSPALAIKQREMYKYIIDSEV